MSFYSQLFKSFLMMIGCTLLLGLAYPLIVTGMGQWIFPKQVNGSLIQSSTGEVIGSQLIGQKFESPTYFWGRPSSSTPAYDGLSSGGSNLGPTNPQLWDNIQKRMNQLSAQNPNAGALIPIDLVMSSGSGLDPDISVAAAYYQAPRVAQERGLSLSTVDQLIARRMTHRQFGFLGEPRVNVLKLNMSLDKLK